MNIFQESTNVSKSYLRKNLLNTSNSHSIDDRNTSQIDGYTINKLHSQQISPHTPTEDAATAPLPVDFSTNYESGLSSTTISPVKNNLKSVCPDLPYISNRTHSVFNLTPINNRMPMTPTPVASKYDLRMYPQILEYARLVHWTQREKQKAQERGENVEEWKLPQIPSFSDTSCNNAFSTNGNNLYDEYMNHSAISVAQNSNELYYNGYPSQNHQNFSGYYGSRDDSQLCDSNDLSTFVNNYHNSHSSGAGNQDYQMDPFMGIGESTIAAATLRLYLQSMAVDGNNNNEIKESIGKSAQECNSMNSSFTHVASQIPYPKSSKSSDDEIETLSPASYIGNVTNTSPPSHVARNTSKPNCDEKSQNLIYTDTSNMSSYPQYFLNNVDSSSSPRCIYHTHSYSESCRNTAKTKKFPGSGKQQKPDYLSNHVSMPDRNRPEIKFDMFNSNISSFIQRSHLSGENNAIYVNQQCSGSSCIVDLSEDAQDVRKHSNLLHPNDCRPCAFFWTKGCQNGDKCKFCHDWHAPRKKKPMKDQRNLMIIARPDGKIEYIRCSLNEALVACEV